jgi:hypothetical protein
MTTFVRQCLFLRLHCRYVGSGRSRLGLDIRVCAEPHNCLPRSRCHSAVICPTINFKLDFQPYGAFSEPEKRLRYDSDIWNSVSLFVILDDELNRRVTPYSDRHEARNSLDHDWLACASYYCRISPRIPALGMSLWMSSTFSVLFSSL